MRKNYYNVFCFYLWMFLSMLFMVECKHGKKLVPALYIFGDSINDNGNNNYLATKAKANYKPYGIDHPLGTTGRFCNGRIISDFFDEWLGLGYQPPILKVKANPRADKTHDGFNYASAAAGLFKDTGTFAGKNLCMREQVRLFNDTVRHYLPKIFENEQELADHLSKSIFIIVIGVNDLHLNFNKSKHSTNHHPHDPVRFNKALIKELKKCLKHLYQLGARKFVIGDAPALGSWPGADKNLNGLIRMFNSMLLPMLDILKAKLEDSIFTNFKLFDITYRIVNNPEHYGFSETLKSCCATHIKDGPGCVRNGHVCEDRDSRVFFDAGHPTEAVYKSIATRCFNGKACTPLNLKQLAKK